MIDLEKSLKLNAEERPKTSPSASGPKAPLPGPTLELPPMVIVKDLAQLINVKPFRIIADLMELGLLASVNETVSFDVAAKILAEYGVFARKAS